MLLLHGEAAAPVPFLHSGQLRGRVPYQLHHPTMRLCHLLYATSVPQYYFFQHVKFNIIWTKMFNIFSYFISTLISLYIIIHVILH